MSATTLDSLELRLQQKIRVDPATGCWLWLGSIDCYGYGRVKMFGKNRQAHVAVWELLVGPLGEGMTLDHLKAERGPCRHKHCCNPAHLERVSRSENTARGNYDRKLLRLAV